MTWLDFFGASDASPACFKELSLTTAVGFTDGSFG